MEEDLHPAWEKLKGGKKKKMAKKSSKKDELFSDEPVSNPKEVSLDGEDLDDQVEEEVEEEVKKEKSKPDKLKKEVTINFTINPHNLLKWGGVVLLAVFIFFMGTLVGNCDSDSCEVATEELSEDSGSFVSSVSGFFTSMFSGDAGATTGAVTVESDTTESEDEEESADETEEAPVEDETEETSEPEEAEEEVEEEVEEEIITKYSKVALAINDVEFDWKGTWGKITKLKYTIKNNEAGTIKPDYIQIEVEGYPDDGSKKKAPLPPSSKTVKSGTKVSSTAAVTGGFSYSELSAGDLSDVVITASLFDADGKLMATFKKGYNLQG